MQKTFFLAPIVAAVAVVFAGPVAGQSTAPAAKAAPADAAASTGARPERRHIAKRDGANASGRDLSDGSAAPGAATDPASATARKGGHIAKRDGANASGRDLSDGSPPAASPVAQPRAAKTPAPAASGSRRKRLATPAARDDANSAARDLSDGSATPRAKTP